MIRSTYGSKGIARYRYEQVKKLHEENHPAVRAQLGRLFAYQNLIPQNSSVTPEAIAWRRETKAAPGYMNRTSRKKMKYGKST